MARVTINESKQITIRDRKLTREQMKDYSKIYVEALQTGDPILRAVPSNLTQTQYKHYVWMRKTMDKPIPFSEKIEVVASVADGLDFIDTHTFSFSPAQMSLVEKLFDQTMQRNIASTSTQGQSAPQQAVDPILSQIQSVKAKNPSAFLDSLEDQYKRRGRLSPKQKGALQRMFDELTNPPAVDTALLDRLDNLLKGKRGNTFIKSLRDQVAKGRKLSPRQMEALENNEAKMGIPSPTGMNPIEAKFRRANDEGKRLMLLDQKAWIKMEGRGYYDLPEDIMANFGEWRIGFPVPEFKKERIRARLRMNYSKHPVLSQLRDPMGAIDALK